GAVESKRNVGGRSARRLLLVASIALLVARPARRFTCAALGLTSALQHEPAGVWVVRADEADRCFLVVDAVGSGIHHGVEQDVGVGGGGEVADLTGAGESVIGAEIHDAFESEVLVAIGAIAVGVDYVEIDEVAGSVVEIRDHVGRVAGGGGLGNGGPVERIGATAAGQDIDAKAATDAVLAIVADDGVVEIVAVEIEDAGPGRVGGFQDLDL